MPYLVIGTEATGFQGEAVGPSALSWPGHVATRHGPGSLFVCCLLSRSLWVTRELLVKQSLCFAALSFAVFGVVWVARCCTREVFCSLTIKSRIFCFFAFCGPEFLSCDLQKHFPVVFILPLEIKALGVREGSGNAVSLEGRLCH